MNCFEISLTLTEEGANQYQSVIAAVFRYIEILRKVLAQIKEFSQFKFFEETKNICSVGYKFFKIPDPINSVCELANELIFTKNLPAILKESYADFVIEEIPMEVIHELLDLFTIENAKITVFGKNLLQKDMFKSQSQHIKTEHWFKTKYIIIDKQLEKLN